MTRTSLINAVFVLTLTLGWATASRADSDTLDVTLAPAAQTVVDGTLVVVFDGTITNPSATDTVWINADSTSTDSLLVSVDDLGLINVPFFLDPGQSSGLIADIFEVDLDPTLTPGTYTGVYTLQGGADGGTGTDLFDLADTSFSVTVTPETVPSPEPSALLLLAAGLAALCALRARNLRQPAP
ncbi:MAG: PEP-CTERM sorting domain-containing protein [Candidatus Acidiferrales bacterium]